MIVIQPAMAATIGTPVQQYVTLPDFVVPDRVIFTYTNESSLIDGNLSSISHENASGPPMPVGSTSDNPWWWDSGYPSEYSWPRIIVMAIIITIIILMILIGNFLVMWAIIHDRTLKTSQNLFIASLAFADFMLGLVVIPFSLANELMGYWVFGVIWCELYKAIDVLLCTASIISLCLISLDRYWSITRAVHYARQRTRKRAGVMIFTVWFISAVVSIPPLIGWKQPTRESDWPLCTLSEDIGYVVYSAFGSFFIPAFIMVFVYFKIYQAAKQRARKTVKASVASGDKHDQKHSTDSSVTEHHGFHQKTSQDDNFDGLSRIKTNASLAEGVACKTEGDGIVPTSEDEAIIRNKRLACVINYPEQEGERSNLLATDSETELEPSALKREKRHTILQAVSTSDTISVYTDHDDVSKQTPTNPPAMFAASTGGPVDRNNGSVQRFKILELRPNGNSSTTINISDGAPKRSMIKSLRRHLFVKKRDSRRRKHAAARTDANMNADLQSADKQKRKLAKARERRATVVLGLVMAAFILCWLPFFGLYFASAFCADCIPGMVFTVFFWIGYCNSALNPIIYTVFNRDFRRAFQKIIFGKKQGRQYY